MYDTVIYISRNQNQSRQKFKYFVQEIVKLDKMVFYHITCNIFMTFNINKIAIDYQLGSNTFQISYITQINIQLILIKCYHAHD